MIELLAISAAGGVGATARFLLDGLIRAHASPRYPVATTVINLTGSLLLGLLTGLALGQLLPEPWHLVLGTGFLGGYTTFSTASVETVRLVQERRLLVALAYGLGTLVVAVAVAGAGVWLGLSV